MNVKSLRKQLMAAIAMVLVSTIALGSSTYAWFVSNNTVKAVTTNISAQSNSAYLVIDTKTTSTTSTSSAAAAEEVDEGKVYADAALYPAQWANGFGETHYVYIRSEYVLYTITETGFADVYLDSTGGAPINVFIDNDKTTSIRISMKQHLQTKTVRNG